ncbi:membrane protease subunit HflC [Bathymodiolus platifrons methanotrophic gill symbiont]|uniref:protease modulator HflC n=1 Tax=Bathymodiolus platifrons methanotrophic gill symbiont TaxID=113268 RepID=UPI000B407B01|nr:protease modulator HflC [Bathymodiolus platifrons methanotrophic gill symbiont]MCK5869226.1 protease modulator HflC [Methyloprofundus sp.]TXK96624.1 HflC protein [Methylococcaceae bacterium CS4]TXK99859.1 HflC protein [Methylococcaceae bacterium CS5]TXL06484.1 HflC protein [Methylococcaceae bacterium CS1]TXL07245.1 HflC protein [Methylococcaceae bacterium CS3]TXL10850.1 HflC protein [Methylococcaceae bacterium CS2]TXL14447.1 HflC protein [Methylococcaceae bacterium HT4]TXL20437.1 HflC pr
MSANKILVTVGAIFTFFMMCVFTVTETEKAIKFKFGEIVRSDYQPGLHFKFPFINNVKKFDARILTLDSAPERFLTAEKKNVIVDSFVKWRIGDVTTFYTSVAGDAYQANIRLDQIIKDAFRSEFSKRDIKQLVSTDRSAVREALITNTAKAAAQLGIEIVDVQVKRIDLPSEVSHSVYSRMEAERARVAREFRSQGSEAAERVRADADKQKEIILADAYRDSEIMKGQGDAKAAEIYANAYGRNIEFYAFYRSMAAYKETFSKSANIMVIEPDSEFFKYFKQMK